MCDVIVGSLCDTCAQEALSRMFVCSLVHDVCIVVCCACVCIWDLPWSESMYGYASQGGSVKAPGHWMIQCTHIHVQALQCCGCEMHVGGCVLYYGGAEDLYSTAPYACIVYT